MKNKVEYIKVTKHPIEIHFLPDQDPRYEMQPSFVFNGARYWLKDFLRIKDSPWIKEDNFPDYLDAYQANEYNFPLFLHLNKDQTIDVYICMEKK